MHTNTAPIPRDGTPEQNRISELCFAWLNGGTDQESVFEEIRALQTGKVTVLEPKT